MFRTRRRVVAAGGSVSVALYLAYRAGWLRRLLRRSGGTTNAGSHAGAPDDAGDGGCGTAAATEAAKAHAAQSKHKRKRVGIDAEFWRRLRKLLKVVFPKLVSRPTLLLALHSTYLLSRSLVSIYVSTLDGNIVRALVDRDGRTFVMNIGRWCLLGVLATWINAMIKYLEAKLAIAFRTALTKKALTTYMEHDTYYSVSNLDGRLDNPDQCLTEDIWQWSKMLAHLYSHLTKPMLDVALISFQLVRTFKAKGTGWTKPASLAAIAVWSTSFILKLASPPFGRLVKEQAALDGQYRYVHSRLITNSEEVAFYGGHEVELSVLQRAYKALVKHMNVVYKSRIAYGVLEGWLLKYLWSATGYFLVAFPLFYSERADGQSSSERTQDYIVSRGLLTSAADAVERVMSSYKEVTELAGYTHRVTDMLDVFEDVANGHYQRPNGDPSKEALLAQRGEKVLTDDGTIEFDSVPVVTPIGDVLVDELTLRLEPGMMCLVTGPNGCGKSSLFRILGSLWPLHGGKLLAPRRGQLFYVPQRPYLCLGNLRDQVIYPDTLEVMRSKGLSDDVLDRIMEKVHLGHIIAREGGWDAEKSWMDVLSGGEKQRMGMARVFYHRPRWAILDECTSAVSIDVEGEMYNHAKELGISLLTITHRPSLWQYHDYVLKFDGEGGWSFRQMSDTQVATLQAERESLLAKLSEVPALRRRLDEVCAQLVEEDLWTEADDEEEEDDA